jgi:hypothetical protein
MMVLRMKGIFTWSVVIVDYAIVKRVNAIVSQVLPVLVVNVKHAQMIVAAMGNV